MLQLTEITENKSIFLLGPRRTGKSTLLKTLSPQASYWNLLDSTIYRSLAVDPSFIRRTVLAMPQRPKLIIIDEIQKLPILLDEVHLMIEEYGFKFILSGSSARALRRKGVNLLAGRAHTYFFHPFTTQELGENFNLLQVLNYGSMPPIYLSQNPAEELNQYVGTYLAEEIAFEGLTRQLPAFSRFLEVAGLCSGQQIHFTTIASDAQVKRSTVVDWFDILKDTLIAHELPMWKIPLKRKAVSTAKFYLFDVGVARSLARASPMTTLQGPEVGAAFEHWIFHELKTSCDYKKHKSLHTWRSASHFEVDFILDETWAIEVKAKTHISQNDLKGLRALKEENVCTRYSVVSLVNQKQIFDDGIEVLPYQEFIQEVWK